MEKSKRKKRTQICTVVADNAGFAAWVHGNVVPSNVNPELKVHVYGEWAGNRIQKSDAVNLLPDKHFFIFSVITETPEGEITNYYTKDEIELFLKWFASQLLSLNNVHVIPEFFEEDMIIYNEIGDSYKAFYEDFYKKMTDLAEEIGDKDPYIFDLFGIDGTGEGLVFYDKTNDLYFKMKSAKHDVHNHTKETVVRVIPEEANTFTEEFYTIPRFEQIYSELEMEKGEKLSMKDFGTFIKNVNQDVLKECVPELEKSGLDWKDICKLGVRKIKSWWNSQQLERLGN